MLFQMQYEWTKNILNFWRLTSLNKRGLIFHTFGYIFFPGIISKKIFASLERPIFCFLEYIYFYYEIMVIRGVFNAERE